MEEKSEKKETARKKGSKLPLMIGGIFLVLAVIAGGGIFAMKFFSQQTQAAEEPALQEEVDPGAEVEYAPTDIYYNSFEPFITVLKPGDDYSFIYLKSVPEFELSNAEVAAEIAAKLPAIEDKINASMTDLDWNSIKTERGKERQAEKIMEQVNELLQTGRVIKVYFTTLVAQ